MSEPAPRHADTPLRVLFVCLGNICRSPTAEAVFRARVSQAGWSGLLQADSAGTAAWHVGKAPDARSQDHARARGYDLSGLRARQVTTADFAEFDYILAMDADNLDALRAQEAEARRRGLQPRAQLERLLAFHAGTVARDVPDPYHGGGEGFEAVLDLVEGACDGLLRTLLRRQGVFGCGC